MTRIHTMTIRIEGPDISFYRGDTRAFDVSNQRVVDDLKESEAISNIEDVINDELPDGYYCKVDDS